jgi:hypothetical protein
MGRTSSLRFIKVEGVYSGLSDSNTIRNYFKKMGHSLYRIDKDPYERNACSVVFHDDEIEKHVLILGMEECGFLADI